MKRSLLAIYFSVIGYYSHAQCLTSSLIINTGYNAITGAAIAGGANGAATVQDPHWIVTAISPATGAAIAATPMPGLVAVTPGNKADIVTLVGGAWITNPAGSPGNWISCMNSNTYNDQGTGLLYTMTLGRPFRMCSADSVKINIHIASDNFTSAADIDGTIALPAPATGFNAYTVYTQTVWLTAGTHTLNFVVNNQNLNALGSNPTGLNVYGTISSATGANSLVSESYASCSTYACGSTCNSISLPDSLHLCQGGSDTLRAAIIGTDSVLSLAWTPITGLSSSTVLRPLVTVGTTSGYYYLTVQSLTPYNLVYNGDFSLGNTGFTTTYTYGGTGFNAIYNEGTYSVVTNPNQVHSSAASFGDHTTGTGNMMTINGSGTPTSVWCQTIPVPPFTDFSFSAWAANWSPPAAGSTPILQFMINGVLIGVPLTISSPVGIWTHFYATWNSGANTSASICIYDACTALGGNDFALDDISFQKYCIATDSIYVDVRHIDTTYSHSTTSVCASVSSVTLTAPGGYNSYLWNAGAGTQAINVSTAGSYWVYAPSFCAMLIDTFHVVYKSLPPAPVTRDTVYCKGFTGALPLTHQVDSVPGTLTWYLTAGGAPLSGAPAISTALANYPAGTTWYVSQTVDGCEGPASPVKVAIVPPPDISITARPWVCQFDSISLAYSGPATINGGFLWTLTTGETISGGTTLTDSMVYIKFDSAGQHAVYLTANNLYGECSNYDTVRIDVVALPTANAYTKQEVCLEDTVELALSSKSWSATGFTWYIDNSTLLSSAAANIISANSNSGGPYSISWIQTGIHVIHVQAYADHGCTNVPTYDTVDVHQSPDATFNVVTSGGALCLEDSVWFAANDSNYQDNYLWSPAHFFQNTGKHAVWGRVELQQGVVTLTVTDPFGCTASSSRELDPSVCCTVPFPNAFTPNGDGLNDVFRPIPMKEYHRCHIFRIQNRWGQTVFESTDNKALWDGTFNGVPQDLGVYFYYLKYDCNGKTMEQRGDVTLVR